MEKELKIMEKLIGNLDWLLQEGVVITKKDWNRFWFLEKEMIKIMRSFESMKQLIIKS
jgi:hypothetical protein